MKKTYILFLLCCIVAPHCARAQWQLLTLLAGGQGLVADNNNIVAPGETNGLFVSTNAGKDWIARNSGLFDGNVLAMYAMNGAVYASMQNGGVFRSADTGKSWYSVTHSAIALDTTNVFAFTSINDTLYAGATNWVFRTSDAGAHWQAMDSGLANTTINAMVISGGDVFAGTGSGIFLSKDGGAHWQSMDSGLTYKNVRALAANGSGVFAGTDSGIYFLGNANVQWVPKDSGLWDSSITSLAINNDTIYTGTYNSNLFLSTDNGTKWLIANCCGGFSPLYTIAFLGNYFFTGGQASALYYSTNYGSFWSQFENGFPSIGINSFLTIGGNILVGTEGFGVLLSQDSGVSWTFADNGIANAQAFNTIVQSGQNLYLGTGGGVFLSTNNGLQWLPVDSGLLNLDIDAFAIEDSNIFAGSFGGMFHSTNGGAYWRPDTNGMDGNTAIVSAFVRGNDAALGTNNNGSYYSTDNGAHWQLSDFTQFGTIGVYSFFLSDTDLFTGTSDGVFLSNDYGQTWQSWGLNGYSVVGLAVVGKYVFAACGSYLFVTHDSGYNWTDVTDNVSGCYSLTIDDSFLIVGGNGVFRRPLADFGITAVQDPVREPAATGEMLSSYPNPFSSSTNIVLSTMEEGMERVSIVDVLRREIAVLPESGGHNYVWSPDAAVPDGMYWIVARGSAGVASKAVMRLR